MGKGKTWATLAGVCVLTTGLAISTQAAGNVVLNNTGRTTNDSFVDGTTLLRQQNDDGSYSLTDLDGNVVTDTGYSRSFYYSDGFLEGQKANGEVNSVGLLNLKGDVVVPFEYGDIKNYDEKWVIGFKVKEADSFNYDMESWGSESAYYLIDTVDIYYIGTEGSSKVGTLTRDQFIDANASGDYINIEDRTTGTVTTYDSAFQAVQEVDSTYDFGDLETEEYITFRENGHEGLKDSEGNIVLEPDYQYVYISRGNYVELTDGEHEGLAEIGVGVVVPVEYDDVDYSYYAPVSEDSTGGYEYNNFGYFAVEKEGKLGYVSAGGTVTSEPKYSTDVVENYGASATLTDMEAKLHIFAADGVDTVLEESYDSFNVLSYSAGTLYVARDADYNEILIDWHGQILLPEAYNEIDLSGDGKYLLAQKEYDGPYELYEVNYDAVIAGAEVAAEDTAGQDSESAETTDTSSDVAASVNTLIDSANNLLEIDFEANKSSASVLLEQAAAQLQDSQAEDAAVLKSAAALLNAEGSDLASVQVLLDTVKGNL